jgi:hypothetical protein
MNYVMQEWKINKLKIKIRPYCWGLYYFRYDEEQCCMELIKINIKCLNCFFIICAEVRYIRYKENRNSSISIEHPKI